MAKRKLIFLISLAFLFGVFAASLNWSFYLTAAFTAIFLSGIAAYKKYSWKITVLIPGLFLVFGFFYHNFYVNFQEIRPKTKSEPFWIKQKLTNFKETQVNHFRISLPLNSAALLSGETFGERSDFTKEFKEQMNRSGTTHIVALSGYNIAILVLAVSTALGTFLSRRKTFVITAIVIVLFVIMVGGEASIIRAAIMGFLILLAKELGRPYNLANAIILTASIMVFINPTILTNDIGFQLSFLSLLGIVYLEQPVKKFLKLGGKNSFLNWKENAAMTVSAQLVVAPVLVYRFDQFSLFAIPANILILEAVPLTMFFGFLLAALNSISLLAGFLAAKIANLLLIYQIFMIKLFSAINIPVPSFLSSISFIVAYYFVLILIAGGKLTPARKPL